MKNYNPLQIRKRVQYYGGLPYPVEIPKRNPEESEADYQGRANRWRGAIIGAVTGVIKEKIETTGAGLDDFVHYVFSYLVLPDDSEFGRVSLKEITPQFWNGLSRWHSYYDKEAWEYKTRETFESEVEQILGFAMFALHISGKQPGIKMREINGHQEKIIEALEMDIDEFKKYVGPAVEMEA